MTPTADDVRRVLRLTQGDEAWLSALDEVDCSASAGALQHRDLRSSLPWLGLDARDAERVASTIPDPVNSPERWWLLERFHAVLTEEMPGTNPSIPLRPPRATTLSDTLFPLHVLLAVVPDILAFHLSRDVPEVVSRATLTLHASDTLIKVNDELTGLDTGGWLLWRYRGLLYKVGVLAAIPVRLGKAPDSEHLYRNSETHPAAPGFHRGEPAVSIHIPGGAPLDADSIAESLEAMATAFESWFAPDPGPRIGTCASWALDPQLREYLSPDSSLIRLQEAFTPFGDGSDSDFIMQFVFPNSGKTPLDRLIPQTTLQRAVLVHLQSGRRWRVCSGWLKLR